MPSYSGGCHCGDITVSFRSVKTPAELGLRACDCGFCRRHGADSTSDPQGELTFTVRAEGSVRRYRFGLGITDFLLCARCGVYAGPLSEAGGRTLGVVNANVLEARAAFPDPVPVSYAGESEAARLQRRAARWTPASLVALGSMEGK